MNLTNNVIALRSAYPIFNPELRSQLEINIAPFTDKPAEAVLSVEHTICAYLIAGARSLGSRLGSALGDRIARQFTKETYNAN